MRGQRFTGFAGGLLGAGLLVVLLARCFSPDLPDCSYRCYGSEPFCPDEYECREDGYCHLLGTSSTCPFTDLRQDDLRRVPDAAALDGDADGGDGGEGDLSDGGTD